MPKVFVFNAMGGPEQQELVERPVLEPGPGELAVEVEAAGVNPADAKQRSGAFGPPPALPAPMGLELAGVVSAVGPEVEGFVVGDAVLGPPASGAGAFAEQTLVRADAVVRKPELVSATDAATLPVAGTTAHDLTYQVGLAAGAGVVVLGAGGGVGHLAVQLAVSREARVIGVASESKRGWVTTAGATFVPAGEQAAAGVREILPSGVDLIIDLVGGEPLRALAATLTAEGSIVSAADPETAAELGGAGRDNSDHALERITGLVEAGLIDPHVTQTFPLARAAEALALVEEGHTAGKVVITP